MPRISKASANHAIERVANNIIKSAGDDGRVSRADMKAALSKLDGTEKRLTDVFFRFIDHRDAAPGAQVTKSDVTRAVEYAKEKLIAKYDLNNNGLSKAEISKMSLTGQLAIELAKELKQVASTEPLSLAELGQAITKAAEDTYYISEGDSQPTFVSMPWPADKPITGEAIMKAFEDQIVSTVLWGDGDISSCTFESGGVSLGELGEEDPDADDYYKESAAGFRRLDKVFSDNGLEQTSFRIGMKEDDSDALAVDAGTYLYLIVGKTDDGHLAGVSFESVET